MKIKTWMYYFLFSIFATFFLLKSSVKTAVNIDANLKIDSLDALQLKTLEPKLLDADGIFPRWSPDGRNILYTKKGQIWIMDKDGANKHLLVDSAWCGNWSPDGRRIVYVSRKRNKISIFDLNKKEEFEILEWGDQQLAPEYPLRWTNDPRFIICGHDLRETDQLTLIDLETLEEMRSPQKIWRDDLRQLYVNPEEYQKWKDKIEKLKEGIDWNMRPSKFFVGEFNGPYIKNTAIKATVCGMPLCDIFSEQLFSETCQGIWIGNKDLSYWQRIPQARSEDPQLSPNLNELLYVWTPYAVGSGIYLIKFVKRPNSIAFVLSLGSKDGIKKGDIFRVYEPKINPLTDKVVGYEEKKIKGAVVVVDVSNTSCKVVPIVEIPWIKTGDAGVLLRTNLYGFLKEINPDK